MPAAIGVQNEFNWPPPFSPHRTETTSLEDGSHNRGRRWTMKNIFVIAGSLMLASTVSASAHSVDAARDRQADRIEQGRETGKITWTEGLRLRGEQYKIART